MGERQAENTETVSQLRKTAIRSAVVSGAFSLIVAGLLLMNYLQIKVFDPVRAERLELLKVNIIERPGDEQLLSEIRQLDLKIRRDRIGRKNLSHSGGLLLLGGILVFLISAKIAASCTKVVPQPRASSEERAVQLRQAKLARRAMLGGLAILLVGTVVLTLRPEKDFAKIESRLSSYASAEELGRNWPRFRGPGGLGISAHSNIPLRFDVAEGGSVLWKTQIPLPGYNSPIVWEDRVFLSGAQRDRREVYCFDASSGEPLWTGEVPSSGPSSEQVEPMEDTGFAASTMATDGRRVFAIFATGDIAAFSFDGERLWAKNLGTPDSAYGYATSLEVYRNLVLIQYDQGTAEENKSRLIALDGFSGRTVWEIKRPVPGSWTSPIVAQTPQGPQLITCADPLVIAYDPQNGRELWQARCLGADVAPSLIFAGGLVFAVNSNVELVAIKVDGSGDVSKTHIAWRAEDGIPDICSPVSDGELVFLLTSHYAKLTCYRVSDGTKLWQQDFEESFNASPSLVGGLLYLLATDGTMIVAQAGTEYKEQARSELTDICRGSPAFADGRIFIRGAQNLYCIGNSQVE